ncbi:hypothetical protein GCM10023203_10630 [Actinomycetospora straminea]|uniref:Uncharacterized protein n=1 Tax=Actinomycetospora straminea TaxID=663607 RepID=A0ABP9E6K5_9PSEU
MVAGAGLGHEGGQPGHDQQVAAGALGAADAVEQLDLVELAAGDQHDVDAVLGDHALEIGQGPDVRGERGGGAVAAVVEEAGDREPVTRVTLEELDDVGGERAPADHERAVRDHPAPARREDEPRRRHPEHHQPEAGQDDQQERLDALALVAQREHRRDQRRSHEQPADDHRQLVEDREVQARPVTTPPHSSAIAMTAIASTAWTRCSSRTSARCVRRWCSRADPLSGSAESRKRERGSGVPDEVAHRRQPHGAEVR